MYKFLALFLSGVLAGLLVRAQSLHFSTLSLSDGLSQATINCFEQDSRGFIWIGTKDGLNRYDGYNFLIFRNRIGDSLSISNNAVSALESCSDGSMWVGTGSGLNKVNTKSMQFKSYAHWFKDSLSISSNRIRCLAEDANGKLWIGTDNGLNIKKKASSSFERFSIQDSDPTSLSNNVINDILIDSNKNVWIGTEGGLNLYDPSTNSFIRYRNQFEDDNSLSDNAVLCMIEDSDGNIWIGTKNGLNKFHPDLQIFSRYFKNSPREGLLSSNHVSSLVLDSNQDLWVGTPSGLNRFYADINQTATYRSSANNSRSLPNDHILCLFTDYSGMLWIGTQSAGIATINLEAPQFNSFTFSSGDYDNPSTNQIYSFCRRDSNTIWIGTAGGIKCFDTQTNQETQFRANNALVFSGISAPIRVMRFLPDSVVWIGTDGMGLYFYDLKTDSSLHFLTDADDPYSISSNRIVDILPDTKGNLWLATFGGGLSYLDVSSETFTNRRFDGSDPNSLRDNNISSLATTADGTLWVGTGNAGMYYLTADGDKLEHFEGDTLNHKRHLANSINQLYVDQSDRLWIATAGEGIGMMPPRRRRFEIYTKEEGLANDVALALISDQAGVMWISTNGGITAFNYETNTFRNYSDEDVLGKNTFNVSSSFQNSDGSIFFGGANGFDYFNSDGLKENTFVPPIYITGFQLIDEREENFKAQMAVKRRNDLELDYNHSGFSLEFAALNFKQSDKNQYAFRLLGLFDKWRYIGNRHFTTFSNLNPGKYTFEVIGSNNDGLWNNEPATLNIIVKPAFWQTALFQILALLAIFGLLYLFYRYKLASEKARTQVLEEAVDTRTKEISKERDTNAILLKEVHHRVKNNLQIIVSLLNLQSRFISDAALLDTFGEIQNRVRSMSLIHQKMYKTKDLKTVNITEYITDLAESLLRTYRIGHQVELDVHVEVNSFNSDTLTPLGLIINEIISNALKYAFEEDRKGLLFVRLVKIGSGRFRLTIGDNGIGLHHDQRKATSESFGTELIGALTEQLNGTIILMDDQQGTVYQLDFEDEGS